MISPMDIDDFTSGEGTRVVTAAVVGDMRVDHDVCYRRMQPWTDKMMRCLEVVAKITQGTTTCRLTRADRFAAVDLIDENGHAYHNSRGPTEWSVLSELIKNYVHKAAIVGDSLATTADEDAAAGPVIGLIFNVPGHGPALKACRRARSMQGHWRKTIPLTAER